MMSTSHLTTELTIKGGRWHSTLNDGRAYATLASGQATQDFDAKIEDAVAALEALGIECTVAVYADRD